MEEVSNGMHTQDVLTQIRHNTIDDKYKWGNTQMRGIANWSHIRSNSQKDNQ